MLLRSPSATRQAAGTYRGGCRILIFFVFHPLDSLLFLDCDFHMIFCVCAFLLPFLLVLFLTIIKDFHAVNPSDSFLKNPLKTLKILHIKIIFSQFSISYRPADTAHIPVSAIYRQQSRMHLPECRCICFSICYSSFFVHPPAISNTYSGTSH
jgi:hypothetical protein